MLLEHAWKSLLLKRLHKAPFFSIMADECTDVTTIEELTICCHWVESGVPEEHFIEILPLKKLMLKVSILHLWSTAGKRTFSWEGL